MRCRVASRTQRQPPLQQRRRFIGIAHPDDGEIDWSQPQASDNKRVAILGGGLTGLTTAYYLASVAKSSTKITLYEASDRLGGWIRTDRVPVDVGGKKGTVTFERGPRSLSSLWMNTSRFDDLILYDLVRGNFQQTIGMLHCNELTMSFLFDAAVS
jgi:hypothetical protein